ncbi:hypothetical protein LJC40_06445, partial [Synergistaceae bacterium OttesenSCG-928-D05]|nr:hypothetical protein [Synergistaceae bacterium OttesenSCG-928-D05]
KGKVSGLFDFYLLFRFYDLPYPKTTYGCDEKRQALFLRKAMRRTAAMLEFKCFHLFRGGLGHFVNFPQYDFFS